MSDEEKEILDTHQEYHYSTATVENGKIARIATTFVCTSEKIAKEIFTHLQKLAVKYPRSCHLIPQDLLEEAEQDQKSEEVLDNILDQVDLDPQKDDHK